VGQKEYKGLELDERTGGKAISNLKLEISNKDKSKRAGGRRDDQLARKMIRLREGERTMLGERTAERKESLFLEGQCRG
jgi:hypothetical protein